MKSQELVNKIQGIKDLGGHKRFYELLLEIAELHARKNHDYAKDGDPMSNLRMCEAVGVPAYKGVLVRLSDKWSRITELSKKEAQVADESIKDTLRDMAVYALLGLILLEEGEAKK
jgi:hypothetical protein